MDDFSASYVSSYKRVAERGRGEPIQIAAKMLGKVCDDSQQTALAFAALSRSGECGVRNLLEQLLAVPVVPASLESSRSPPCLICGHCIPSSYGFGCGPGGPLAPVIRRCS